MDHVMLTTGPYFDHQAPFYPYVIPSGTMTGQSRPSDGYRGRSMSIPSGIPGGFPPGFPGGPMPFFPPTPTSSNMQFPDTTVKSGSEFGDTPPSSGSSSNTRKRNFKSPEDEKRYRLKRARNNEAAKKSRKSRKEKETGLMEENNILKQQLVDLRAHYEQQLMLKDIEIGRLQNQLTTYHNSFQSNQENVDPVGMNDAKSTVFQFSNSMNR